MKKILLIIFVSSIFSCYAQPTETHESVQNNDFYQVITEYARLQELHKELEQLRRHAQTAAKLLWLEKNEKNVELCREIVRRYLKALEKLPEYDEQKQAWKKAVQEFMNKNNKNQHKESSCYTAS